MADRRLWAGLALTGLAVALGATILARPVPRLLWNTTASAPPGLYWIQPGRALAVGDWAVAWLPEPERTLAAERRYLPANVPLVKHVAAVAGQHVCAAGRTIRIDGALAAERKERDRVGRALPYWQGCRWLGAHEIFLLGAAADSFDGRYFGPTGQAAMVGRAVPLWTW